MYVHIHTYTFCFYPQNQVYIILQCTILLQWSFLQDRSHAESQNIRPKIKGDINYIHFFSDHDAMIIKINCKAYWRNNTNIRKLNSLMNSQWAIEEIKWFKKTKANKNTSYQNLWVTAKAILRENFIILDSFIRKKYQ